MELLSEATQSIDQQDAVAEPPSAQSAPVSAEAPTLRDGFLKLFSHLSSRRRRQMVALLALSVEGSIAELGAIGALLPFLALLADPSLASRGPAARAAFSRPRSGSSLWRPSLASCALY